MNIYASASDQYIKEIVERRDKTIYELSNEIRELKKDLKLARERLSKLEYQATNT